MPRIITIVRLYLAPLALGVLFLAAGREAAAQGESAGEKPLTVEELDNRFEALQAAPGLDEAGKAKIQQQLQQATAHVKRAVEFEAEARGLAEALSGAADRIKALRREREEGAAAAAAAAEEAREAASLPLAEVEARVKQREAEAAAAEAALKAVEGNQAKLRSADALRQLLAENEKQRRQIQADLQVPAPAETPAPAAEAARLLLLARQQQLQAEARSLQSELAGYEARRDLLAAQRELAQARREALAARLKLWQEQALQRRQEEATQARQEAERAQALAAQLPPAVTELAAANVELSRSLEELAALETKLTLRRQQVAEETKRIEAEFALEKKRVEAAGLTETIGLLLQSRRRTLPNLDRYRRAAVERRAEIGRFALLQIDVEERRRQLPEKTAAVAEAMNASDREIPAVFRQERRRETARVQESHRELLEKLDRACQRHLAGLGEVDFQERELVSLAGTFAGFIDRYLLWSRSASPIGVAFPGEIAAGAAWLLGPEKWIGFFDDLRLSWLANPLAWVLAVLLMGGLIAMRRPARARLRRLAEPIGRVETDSFLFTVRALFWTALLALLGPALLALPGWHLAGFTEGGVFTRAVGRGLLWAAAVWAMTGSIRQLALAEGVGHRHFRWPQPARESLVRHLRWLLPLILISGFVAETVGAAEVDRQPGQRLALAAFMVLMVALSLFCLMALRPGGPILAAVARRNPRGPLFRLRRLWLPVAAGGPILLAGASAVGYDYTARELFSRVLATTWLVLGLLLANELLVRWLFVAHRRLAHAEARRRREAAGGEGGEAEAVQVEEVAIDHAAINSQTRALFGVLIGVGFLVGAWAIWAEVLPALQVFHEVRLWSYTVATVEGERAVPVTLASLGQALLVVFFTFAAYRNLPGVLEIVLLNRFASTPGGRYAATTLFRYVIAGAGVVLAFGTLGLSWSQVQWLVAALGVGLGFGLQEIFANFISGLILLFERPIRVGDVVTIGSTSGLVTRIRIRATTITDWDRRELVVPNKEFITGQLVNWTLSDTITRVVIPVGVAYGSDTAEVEEILRRVARQNPRVMADPKPDAVFLSFGDNTLNFELRVFVRTLDQRVPVGHELHRAIDLEFQRAGIAIAFPQRDVHLDAARPLDIRLLRDRGRPEADGGGAQRGGK